MADARGTETAVVTFAEPAEATAEEEARQSIERLLEHVPEAASPEAAVTPEPRAAAEQPPRAYLAMARVISVKGREAQIVFRGKASPVTATIDEGVDRALVEGAAARGDMMLVEVDPGATPVVVGMVQRRAPETLELRADRVVIEAGRELLLRSGRGALRIREDGDVELVGSRISTVSRGLFRVVGRILRLN
jgi:hypothetical protein